MGWGSGYLFLIDLFMTSTEMKFWESDCLSLSLWLDFQHFQDDREAGVCKTHTRFWYERRSTWYDREGHVHCMHITLLILHFRCSCCCLNHSVDLAILCMTHKSVHSECRSRSIHLLVCFILCVHDWVSDSDSLFWRLLLLFCSYITFSVFHGIPFTFCPSFPFSLYFSLYFFSFSLLAVATRLLIHSLFVDSRSSLSTHFE